MKNESILGGTVNASDVEGLILQNDFRTGHTTYEIEISRDDKGYYFDIHQIDCVDGDSFSVKECIKESSVFGTRAEAVDAAKTWLTQHQKQ